MLSANRMFKVKDQQGHNDNAQFCFNNKNQIIMFLIRVLQEILNDKECKKAQNSELKKICQSAIDELTNNNDLSGQRDTLPDLIAQIDYNRYFEPFELASKTGSVKLVQLSLDSIQKFIAHGHLLGNCEDPLEPGKHLIDRIIKMICSCFKGEQTNEGVQLQILKALLTILTSQLVDVHASSLLLSIKTCFNICLISRSLINQTTARATLTQIINVVFFKMEQEASSGKHASMLTHTTQLDVDQTNRLENYSLVAGEHDYEIFQLLEEMVSRISADQGSEDQVPSKLRRFSDVLLENSTLSQHDAFYVISSLCKISQRPLILNSTEERIVSSLEYRSKQLSLQLILAILQNPGPELQSNPIFLSVIRNQLCISLSNNAVSKIPAIFELSMAIFIGLLANFKQYLKLHIEVVFKEILFPILDSPNSSFQHKLIVLRALMAICSDRQIILDIYINYDCNLRSFNVLEQLVHELSRIAQGRTIADLGCSTSEEEYSFRIIGIECLVAILYSMKDWAIDMLNDCSDKRSRSNSESSHSSSYSEVKMSELMQDPMNFELIKNHKNIVEYGIELFNQKPSTGLRFLQEQNILKTECTDVASFLHMYEEKLNKRVVGEFLGLGEKLNKEIMFAYVDQLDLSEMSFIAALRKFLSGFRLPGEAQKIDRLMEKFAARYCECNQYLEIFSSADTAYVLAYSIIMLTTDLHSAQIKHKMTKDQYINLNKGINESRDLPYNYLSKIYDEIANEELRMKYPDDERKSKVSEANQNRNRRLLFGMEMEHIQYIARSLIENAASWPTDNFMTASHSGHVGPMFRILWSPCLASFSIGLQNSENRDIVQLCLKGIQTSIFISGIFSHYIERDAFLQALIHFTSINPSSPSSTFKYKNVKCIQSLIDTSFESGNYLLSSWTKVLRCLSQIELEYMQSSGESPDSTRNHNLSEYVISNGSHQNFIVAVDRIFANSVNFNGDSIVEFVKALCSVSAEELKRSPPRTYCLQKILEISYYNMDRVRLQWSRTWSFVADHLINACSSNNLEVVTFALDSLRQLSLKFLEKEELTNFHFQEDFLRPFASIMRNNSFVAIRDMIIRCVLQMINAQAGNIRSGWKNLITVILIGASDPKKDIANLAFQCICRICEDLLEIYFNNMVDALQDCIKCLAEFASCAESPDVATNSLYLISHIADHLSRHHDIFNDKYDEEAIGVAIEDRIWVKGWLPIVFECSSIINRCRSNIRNQTISTLFDILNKYGNEFKLCWWDDAFSVIFRFFERSPEAGEGSNVEWSTTACMQVLHCLTDLYCSDNFDILRDMLLRKLCPLIMRILKSGHIELSRAAMRCLEKLAFTCCDKFNDDEWKVLLSSICSIIGSLDQTKNMANGFNKEVVNTNRCNSSYAQSAATDSILRDELINCIIGIFRNKSVLESRIQFIRQNTKDINQLLGYKTLDYMSTKVFQYAPKNLVIPVLESFGKCLEDNCGQLNNGDISRCVTAAWLELEISRNSDTFVEDCTLSYLRRTLAILMKSESNDLFIARDRAYIEIAVILLEIYFIQDENTFIELVKRIKEDLCWSISAVAEYHYRFILAQIFLRL